MGPGYEAPLVLGVLAVGHLLSLAHRGAYRILVGINCHGRAGVAEACGTLAAAAIAFLFVGVFGWGIMGAAIAIALAVTVGGGLFPAFYICRALKLPIGKYARQVLPGPMLAVLPLVICLLLARLWFAEHALLELIAGVGGGGAILAAIYWRYVLPSNLKPALLRRLPISRARRPGNMDAIPSENPHPGR